MRLEDALARASVLLRQAGYGPPGMAPRLEETTVAPGGGVTLSYQVYIGSRVDVVFGDDGVCKAIHMHRTGAVARAR